MLLISYEFSISIFSSFNRMAAVVIVYGTFLRFSIFVIIFPMVTTSITEFEALIKLKQSFTNAAALDSWKPGTEPCAGNRSWAGVKCENGTVSGVHLENSGLAGKVDVDALASLLGLRSIVLTSNAFSGPVPDFHRIRRLTGLYISDNRFSGEISSDYFMDMGGLEKVWLSRNNFSGLIPSSLGRVSLLMELHLEDNQFSGNVPPLEQLSLISLNLSNNNLEGEIPPGLSKFIPTAFEGNPGLSGENFGRSSLKSPGKQKKLLVAILCLVTFCAVLLLMIAGIYTIRRKNKSCHEQAQENLDINPLGSSRKGLMSSCKVELEVISNEKYTFGMDDLMRADAESLGTGTLGSSYKATMPSGLTVVVKRMTEMSTMGREKFDVEMRKFGNLEHKNVLTPLAYHYRKEEKLLVYEYQHTGSLMFLLHGDRGISHANLNWPVRLNIIRGIANGLSYLHTKLSTLDLPHGNLQSSNVLLTPDYEPLLVDYGLCSLISRGQAVQTLMAYKSPEAILDHSNISPKCDVYCLGTIILEILTGIFPGQYHNNSQGGSHLVQWVRSAIVEGREAELLNPDIANATEFVGEMEQLLRIGADCTEDEPGRRLDLREAVGRLDVKWNQTFHILPSFKDGILDEQPRVAIQSSNRSTSRVDSVGDASSRSFVFEIP